MRSDPSVPAAVPPRTRLDAAAFPARHRLVTGEPAALLPVLAVLGLLQAPVGA